jgi:hypothetical protein
VPRIPREFPCFEGRCRWRSNNRAACVAHRTNGIGVLAVAGVPVLADAGPND